MSTSKSGRTVLKTARLTLRAARPDDLSDLFEVFGDPVAMRYWSSAADKTEDQLLPRLNRMINSDDTQPTTYFVIERDGRAIGTAGGASSSEIGFILHRAYWRQGIVSEALSVIIPHLWQVLDVPELTADVDPRNDASVGLLKSLGFKVTGTEKNTYFINGEWSDSVYFALARPT